MSPSRGSLVLGLCDPGIRGPRSWIDTCPQTPGCCSGQLAPPGVLWLSSGWGPGWTRTHLPSPPQMQTRHRRPGGGGGSSWHWGLLLLCDLLPAHPGAHEHFFVCGISSCSQILKSHAAVVLARRRWPLGEVPLSLMALTSPERGRQVQQVAVWLLGGASSAPPRGKGSSKLLASQGGQGSMPTCAQGAWGRQLDAAIPGPGTPLW